jgi:hypothetical protein
MTVDEYRERLRERLEELGRESATKAGRALVEDREIDNAFYEGETHRTLEALALLDEITGR